MVRGVTDEGGGVRSMPVRGIITRGTDQFLIDEATCFLDPEAKVKDGDILEVGSGRAAGLQSKITGVGPNRVVFKKLKLWPSQGDSYRIYRLSVETAPKPSRTDVYGGVGDGSKLPTVTKLNDYGAEARVYGTKKGNMLYMSDEPGKELLQVADFKGNVIYLDPVKNKLIILSQGTMEIHSEGTLQIRSEGQANLELLQTAKIESQVQLELFSPVLLLNGRPVRFVGGAI